MIKVYQLSDGQEIHMVGGSVGVIWNTRKEKRPVQDVNGNKYQVEVPIKAGSPYIVATWIEEYDGKHYRNEDNPVAGGMSAKEARDIAKQLIEAADYLESLDAPAD